MNRRTFLASLPAIGMVGEEKKTDAEMIDGFEVVKFSDGTLMPCTKIGSNKLCWIEAQRACMRLWGKEAIGQPMTVTVHEDGYDVRFAE